MTERETKGHNTPKGCPDEGEKKNEGGAGRAPVIRVARGTPENPPGAAAGRCTQQTDRTGAAADALPKEGLSLERDSVLSESRETPRKG